MNSFLIFEWDRMGIQKIIDIELLILLAGELHFTLALPLLLS
jgi:hypothetical protein